VRATNLRAARSQKLISEFKVPHRRQIDRALNSPEPTSPQTETCRCLLDRVMTFVSSDYDARRDHKSGVIAAKHYLQVTDEHFASAAGATTQNPMQYVTEFTSKARESSPVNSKTPVPYPPIPLFTTTVVGPPGLEPPLRFLGFRSKARRNARHLFLTPISS
jgi:hypothetical protein